MSTGYRVERTAAERIEMYKHRRVDSEVIADCIGELGCR